MGVLDEERDDTAGTTLRIFGVLVLLGVFLDADATLDELTLVGIDVGCLV